MRQAAQRLGRFGVLACAAAASVTAWGAQVAEVRVQHDGNRYHIEATLRVDVARPAAFAAATDFPGIAAHAKSIVSAERLAGNRLSSRVSMCVLFYCKTVQQVSEVHLTPSSRIDMVVVPDQGDFESGEAHWRFRWVGAAQSLVSFSATLVPPFWVPSMIGDWAMSHALRTQILDTGRAIETLAGSQ